MSTAEQAQCRTAGDENPPQKPGPHGANCRCPPESIDAPQEQQLREEATKKLIALLTRVCSDEKDHTVRLSALVHALAGELVSYSHEDGTLILDTVMELRDACAGRISNAVTARVLERIAQDPHTIATAGEEKEALGTLMNVLGLRTRRSPLSPSLPAALAAVLRGKKD